ncbi:MAG: NAD(P)-binding protein [Myxococcales bacterium]|nr:NAD(P)-binding protein [Myxococcales bacterium]
MEPVDYLVVGAGISGLSFANTLLTLAHKINQRPTLLIVEASSTPGGYCKTIKRDQFVWDYSGHFFHFSRPDIEAWLRARMPHQQLRSVQKRSYIRYASQNIDFPFQKNIHQLPQADFIRCLHDLWFRQQHYPECSNNTFKQMLYQRFGQGIADAFLIPYNEKLYACDLDTLEPDAMGRFFPQGDADDIIRNLLNPNNQSYNSTFTYPVGGAVEYVNALLHDLPSEALAFNESLESINLADRTAQTSKRTFSFRRLISSQPLPHLLKACQLQAPQDAFSWNQVLVFNLGFDTKGPSLPHWIYFPSPDTRFYRVGWYDNIMDGPQMSLYVEIGGKQDEVFDVENERLRVMEDLRKEKIVTTQKLIAHHHVILNPAYVHITHAAQKAQAQWLPVLHAAGVYPVGRYGSWTYCSIEDNIIETQALAQRFRASV